MARIALDAGHTFLWPPGVSSIHEISNELYEAFSYATIILSWQRNLPSDEMPPHWMWPFSDELVAWFDDIQRAREEKYNNPSDNRERSEMMENDFSWA